MRILIDTNVVLDFLQERKPFAENAARLDSIECGNLLKKLEIKFPKSGEMESQTGKETDGDGKIPKIQVMVLE